jgi:hypothetical protein
VNDAGWTTTGYAREMLAGMLIRSESVFFSDFREQYTNVQGAMSREKWFEGNS